MSDDPPPPDFTVTSEVPRNTAASAARPHPPRYPGDGVPPLAEAPRSEAALGPDGGQHPFGPAPIPFGDEPGPGGLPVPVMLEGAVRSYDGEVEPAPATSWVRALVTTGQEHFESLYRRQAAVAGVVLVVLAAIGTLTFPRSWRDPGPGLPVEAGPGENRSDQSNEPVSGRGGLSAVIEPTTTDVGVPAAPTTQRPGQRRVTASPAAVADRSTEPALEEGDAGPTVTTLGTPPVVGVETSATVGGCHDPLPIIGCIGQHPPPTDAATTVPPTTVVPIEEFPITTVPGRVVTTVDDPPATDETTTTTEKPTPTTAEPTTTTEKPTPTTAEPTTTTTVDTPTTEETTTTEVTTTETTESTGSDAPVEPPTLPT